MFFRTSHSIDSQPEVIPFKKWAELKSESKNGLSNWIKGAFHGGKREVQDGLQQRLNSLFSTTPMWDRYVKSENSSVPFSFLF